MNHPFETISGHALERMEIRAYNIEDRNQLAAFLKPVLHEIQVPFSPCKVQYDPNKKMGIGISRLGTSRAVSIGAYAYALHKLDV